MTDVLDDSSMSDAGPAAGDPLVDNSDTAASVAKTGPIPSMDDLAKSDAGPAARDSLVDNSDTTASDAKTYPIPSMDLPVEPLTKVDKKVLFSTIPKLTKTNFDHVEITNFLRKLYGVAYLEFYDRYFKEEKKNATEQKKIRIQQEEIKAKLDGAKRFLKTVNSALLSRIGTKESNDFLTQIIDDTEGMQNMKFFCIICKQNNVKKCFEKELSEYQENLQVNKSPEYDTHKVDILSMNTDTEALSSYQLGKMIELKIMILLKRKVTQTAQDILKEAPKLRNVSENAVNRVKKNNLRKILYADKVKQAQNVGSVLHANEIGSVWFEHWVLDDEETQMTDAFDLITENERVFQPDENNLQIQISIEHVEWKLITFTQQNVEVQYLKIACEDNSMLHKQYWSYEELQSFLALKTVEGDGIMARLSSTYADSSLHILYNHEKRQQVREPVKPKHRGLGGKRLIYNEKRYKMPTATLCAVSGEELRGENTVKCHFCHISFSTKIQSILSGMHETATQKSFCIFDKETVTKDDVDLPQSIQSFLELENIYQSMTKQETTKRLAVDVGDEIEVSELTRFWAVNFDRKKTFAGCKWDNYYVCKVYLEEQNSNLGAEHYIQDKKYDINEEDVNQALKPGNTFVVVPISKERRHLPKIDEEKNLNFTTLAGTTKSILSSDLQVTRDRNDMFVDGKPVYWDEWCKDFSTNGEFVYKEPPNVMKSTLKRCDDAFKLLFEPSTPNAGTRFAFSIKKTEQGLGIKTITNSNDAAAPSGVFDEAGRNVAYPVTGYPVLSLQLGEQTPQDDEEDGGQYAKAGFTWMVPPMHVFDGGSDSNVWTPIQAPVDNTYKYHDSTNQFCVEFDANGMSANLKANWKRWPGMFDYFCLNNTRYIPVSQMQRCSVVSVQEDTFYYDRREGDLFRLKAEGLKRDLTATESASAWTLHNDSMKTKVDEATETIKEAIAEMELEEPQQDALVDEILGCYLEDLDDVFEGQSSISQRAIAIIRKHKKIIAENQEYEFVAKITKVHDDDSSFDIIYMQDSKEKALSIRDFLQRRDTAHSNEVIIKKKDRPQRSSSRKASQISKYFEPDNQQDLLKQIKDDDNQGAEVTFVYGNIHIKGLSDDFLERHKEDHDLLKFLFGKQVSLSSLEVIKSQPETLFDEKNIQQFCKDCKKWYVYEIDDGDIVPPYMKLNQAQEKAMEDLKSKAVEINRAGVAMKRWKMGDVDQLLIQDFSGVELPSVGVNSPMWLFAEGVVKWDDCHSRIPDSSVLGFVVENSEEMETLKKFKHCTVYEFLCPQCQDIMIDRRYSQHPALHPRTHFEFMKSLHYTYEKESERFDNHEYLTNSERMSTTQTSSAQKNIKKMKQKEGIFSAKNLITRLRSLYFRFYAPEKQWRYVESSTSTDSPALYCQHCFRQGWILFHGTEHCPYAHNNEPILDEDDAFEDFMGNVGWRDFNRLSRLMNFYPGTMSSNSEMRKTIYNWENFENNRRKYLECEHISKVAGVENFNEREKNEALFNMAFYCSETCPSNLESVLQSFQNLKRHGLASVTELFDAATLMTPELLEKAHENGATMSGMHPALSAIVSQSENIWPVWKSIKIKRDKENQHSRMYSQDDVIDMIRGVLGIFRADDDDGDDFKTDDADARIYAGVADYDEDLEPEMAIQPPTVSYEDMQLVTNFAVKLGKVAVDYNTWKRVPVNRIYGYHKIEVTNAVRLLVEDLDTQENQYLTLPPQKAAKLPVTSFRNYFKIDKDNTYWVPVKNGSSHFRDLEQVIQNSTSDLLAPGCKLTTSELCLNPPDTILSRLEELLTRAVGTGKNMHENILHVDMPGLLRCFYTEEEMIHLNEIIDADRVDEHQKHFLTYYLYLAACILHGKKIPIKGKQYFFLERSDYVAPSQDDIDIDETPPKPRKYQYSWRESDIVAPPQGFINISEVSFTPQKDDDPHLWDVLHDHTMSNRLRQFRVSDDEPVAESTPVSFTTLLPAMFPLKRQDTEFVSAQTVYQRNDDFRPFTPTGSSFTMCPSEASECWQPFQARGVSSDMTDSFKNAILAWDGFKGIQTIDSKQDAEIGSLLKIEKDLAQRIVAENFLNVACTVKIGDKIQNKLTTEKNWLSKLFKQVFRMWVSLPQNRNVLLVSAKAEEDANDTFIVEIQSAIKKRGGICLCSLEQKHGIAAKLPEIQKRVDQCSFRDLFGRKRNRGESTLEAESSDDEEDSGDENEPDLHEIEDALTQANARIEVEFFDLLPVQINQIESQVGPFLGKVCAIDTMKKKSGILVEIQDLQELGPVLISNEYLLDVNHSIKIKEFVRFQYFLNQPVEARVEHQRDTRIIQQGARGMVYKIESGQVVIEWEVEDETDAICYYSEEFAEHALLVDFSPMTENLFAGDYLSQHRNDKAILPGMMPDFSTAIHSFVDGVNPFFYGTIETDMTVSCDYATTLSESSIIPADILYFVKNCIISFDTMKVAQLKTSMMNVSRTSRNSQTDDIESERSVGEFMAFVEEKLGKNSKDDLIEQFETLMQKYSSSVPPNKTLQTLLTKEAIENIWEHESIPISTNPDAIIEYLGDLTSFSNSEKYGCALINISTEGDRMCARVIRDLIGKKFLAEEDYDMDKNEDLLRQNQKWKAFDPDYQYKYTLFITGPLWEIEKSMMDNVLSGYSNESESVWSAVINPENLQKNFLTGNSSFEINEFFCFVIIKIYRLLLSCDDVSTSEIEHLQLKDAEQAKKKTQTASAAEDLDDGEDGDEDEDSDDDDNASSTDESEEEGENVEGLDKGDDEDPVDNPLSSDESEEGGENVEGLDKGRVDNPLSSDESEEGGENVEGLDRGAADDVETSSSDGEEEGGDDMLNEDESKKEDAAVLKEHGGEEKVKKSTVAAVKSRLQQFYTNRSRYLENVYGASTKDSVTFFNKKNETVSELKDRIRKAFQDSIGNRTQPKKKNEGLNSVEWDRDTTECVHYLNKLQESTSKDSGFEFLMLDETTYLDTEFSMFRGDCMDALIHMLMHNEEQLIQVDKCGLILSIFNTMSEPITTFTAKNNINQFGVLKKLKDYDENDNINKTMLVLKLCLEFMVRMTCHLEVIEDKDRLKMLNFLNDVDDDLDLLSIHSGSDFSVKFEEYDEGSNDAIDIGAESSQDSDYHPEEHAFPYAKFHFDLEGAADIVRCDGAEIPTRSSKKIINGIKSKAPWFDEQLFASLFLQELTEEYKVSDTFANSMLENFKTQFHADVERNDPQTDDQKQQILQTRLDAVFCLLWRDFNVDRLLNNIVDDRKAELRKSLDAHLDKYKTGTQIVSYSADSDNIWCEFGQGDNLVKTIPQKGSDIRLMTKLETDEWSHGHTGRVLNVTKTPGGAIELEMEIFTEDRAYEVDLSDCRKLMKMKLLQTVALNNYAHPIFGALNAIGKIMLGSDHSIFAKIVLLCFCRLFNDSRIDDELKRVCEWSTLTKTDAESQLCNGVVQTIQEWLEHNVKSEHTYKEYILDQSRDGSVESEALKHIQQVLHKPLVEQKNPLLNWFFVHLHSSEPDFFQDTDSSSSISPNMLDFLYQSRSSVNGGDRFKNDRLIYHSIKIAEKIFCGSLSPNTSDEVSDLRIFKPILPEPDPLLLLFAMFLDFKQACCGLQRKGTNAVFEGDSLEVTEYAENNLGGLCVHGQTDMMKRALSTIDEFKDGDVTVEKVTQTRESCLKSKQKWGWVQILCKALHSAVLGKSASEVMQTLHDMTGYDLIHVKTQYNQSNAVTFEHKKFLKHQSVVERDHLFCVVEYGKNMFSMLSSEDLENFEEEEEE